VRRGNDVVNPLIGGYSVEELHEEGKYSRVPSPTHRETTNPIQSQRAHSPLPSSRPTSPPAPQPEKVKSPSAPPAKPNVHSPKNKKKTGSEAV
jgi:hypothetical protein